MVVMMEGTGLVLGAQVAPALFGYVIGLACTISSFTFGMYVMEWIRTEPESVDDPFVAMEENTSRVVKGEGRTHELQNSVLSEHHKTFAVYFSFSAVAIFLAAFLVGDIVYDSEFCRGMWMSVVLTPLGTITRWKLSKFNPEYTSPYQRRWMPWGTFACNISGAVLSILCTSIRDGLDDVNTGVWTKPFLGAMILGVGGSLTTVSTFVNELVNMTNASHSFRYCTGTIFCAMIVSLVIRISLER